MLRQSRNGSPQAHGVEDVLQHRHAQHQIVWPAGLELREILHQEPAAAREPGRMRSSLAIAIMVGLRSTPVTLLPRARRAAGSSGRRRIRRRARASPRRAATARAPDAASAGSCGCRTPACRRSTPRPALRPGWRSAAHAAPSKRRGVARGRRMHAHAAPRFRRCCSTIAVSLLASCSASRLSPGS